MENRQEQAAQYIQELVTRAKVAQKEFERNYTNQRAIDEVVRAVGMPLCEKGMDIAKAAVAETSMGNIESKVFKLQAMAMLQWNFMKGKNTVEPEDVPDEPGVKMVPKPMGVIGCVMPSTNPIATIIGNGMQALKCRNAVIIAPHPGSAKISEFCCGVIRDALKAIGAPVDLVQCIDREHASIEATNEMLKQCDVNIATGGAGMVKSVYSAGRPAFGVGQGNCQVLIDKDWENYPPMAQTVIGNRAFDEGVPCTGEQTLHVPADREQEFLKAMAEAGAYIMDDPEMISKFRELLFPNGSTSINRGVVGRMPGMLGKMLGVDIPEAAPVILLKNQAKGAEDVLCQEILCPVLRYSTYENFEDAVDWAVTNLEHEGAGHSSSYWGCNEEHITYAAKLVPVGRFHVNNSTLGMGTGCMNTCTIGCGSWGNNSISENLQYYHLMNKTRITTPLPEMKQPVPSDWEDFNEYQF